MSKEAGDNYPNEVLVRDEKLDEPFFLPEDEAKREEANGNVTIVKEEKDEKQTNK